MRSKLAALALSVLGEIIQQHTVHNPVEGTLASYKMETRFPILLKKCNCVPVLQRAIPLDAML